MTRMIQSKRQWGWPSEAPSVRVKFNGKFIDVRVGIEGTLWHWDNGQCVLATSGTAKQWINEHVMNIDARNRLLESCPAFEGVKLSPLDNIAVRSQWK